MNDDVLGPRQAVLGRRYDACGRCGAPAPRDRLASPRLPGEGPALGRARAAEAPPVFLCAACAREVAAGEPLEPDPRDRRAELDA